MSFFTQFDFSVIAPSLPFLWEGLKFTAKLTLIAMSGGIFLGTLLALARLSSITPLAMAATWYVNLMRSIPLLMVILWFFLVIPIFTGKPMGAETSAIITFTAFEAAYFSEIMRAGIQSVPRGQVFAGQAIGMTYWQTMSYVVLPQAFRNMLPILLTQTIILFQDTSLVYAIGAKDLLKAAEIAGKNYGRPLEMYVFVALVYFVVCFALSNLVKHLQSRTAIVR
ncbi:MAG: amino acid ABC transporter permease [Gammaproteobacteria bacterium]|nr:amino acid ABC transporter permease [Rhodocyclaceae bacterium]MBU3910632.1 amino acid ABC transporter permease [Gammaproteobacteria bacterium]MBU4005113.1 amino acid ABC transporter permease [Gammaproteobacteria bacterium]MBU4020706.1 amino acid ABC transporter permease [Gammaproteobacteria bacterium]MBU4095782.1 amino acid ABC transporter permease [Gammaproteobacteria bacterium]